MGGSLATPIYGTIVLNKVTNILPVNFAQAPLPLGTPTTSLAPINLALLSGPAEATGEVPGITAAILAAAIAAAKESYVEGFW
jgi:hypothetical protein